LPKCIIISGKWYNIQRYACKECGYIGKPLQQRRGNFFISMILWSIYALPGLIYSLWGRAGNKSCAKCKSKDLANINSAYGKAMLEEYYSAKISEIEQKK